MPDHCARVLVALASWRAAGSLRVLRTSMSSGIPKISFIGWMEPYSAGDALAPHGENFFLYFAVTVDL
jgi:hypothetical protein